MRSPVIAAAATTPATTGNECTSPRIITMNESNNSTMTPTSTNAQSHSDAGTTRAAPAVAQSSQSSSGPIDAASNMSTPILVDDKTPSTGAKSALVKNPTTSESARVDAPVIAQEINAATPLQVNQCEGLPPRERVPLSSSAEITPINGPLQGKHLTSCKTSDPGAPMGEANVGVSASASGTQQSNSTMTAMETTPVASLQQIDKPRMIDVTPVENNNNQRTGDGEISKMTPMEHVGISNSTRPLSSNMSSMASNSTLNARPLEISASTSNATAIAATINDSQLSTTSGFPSGTPGAIMQSVAVAVDVASGIKNAAGSILATTPTTNPKFEHLSNPVVRPNVEVVVNMKVDTPTSSNQIAVQSIESSRKDALLSSGNTAASSAFLQVQTSSLASAKTMGSPPPPSFAASSMNSPNKLKESMDSNNTAAMATSTSSNPSSTKDSMQVDATVPSSTKSEPGKTGAGRVRSAAEMLDDQSTEDGTSKKEEKVSRPSKRQALLKADIDAFTAAKSKNNNATAVLQNSAFRSQAIDQIKTKTGSSSTTMAAATAVDSSDNQKSTTAMQTGLPMKKAVTTSSVQSRPTGRLLLRSSPIGVNVAKDGNQSKAINTSGQIGAASEGDANEPTAMDTAPTKPPAVKKARGKRKKVSWAKDDELVTVVPIDCRKDLIKAWDPESEITLPFTALTLANFRQEIASEDAAATNPGASSASGQPDAFAASDAPMQHHTDPTHADMNDERRRMEEYRKGYQRKLEQMRPSVNWCEYESVLPPECKGEESDKKLVIIPEVDDGEVPMDDAINRYSPPSPPSGMVHEGIRGGQIDIPWHDSQRKNDQPMHDSMHQVQPQQQMANQHNMQQGHDSRNDYRGRNTSNSFHNPNGASPFRSQPYGGSHDNSRRPGAPQQHHGGAPQYVGGPHGSGSGQHHGGGGYRNQQSYQQGGNMDHRMNGVAPPQHFGNNYRHDGPRGGPGGNPNNNFGNMPNSGVAMPDIGQLSGLLHVLQEQRMLPPQGMMPAPPNFANGGQGPPGYYGPPPVPPPPPGMGRGFPMPPQVMGRPSGFGPSPPPQQQPQQHMGRMMGGRGKMKKKCKYFGTKQGCRDGSSCSFSHEL